jgi:two-component system sensor histidine kinase DegS
LESGVSLLRRALTETRRLITGLRSETLEEVGVVAAIEELIGRIQALEKQPQIDFVHRVAFDRMPAPLEKTVYRIVQEAIQNARRHSQSPRVRAELIQKGSFLQIRIEDWGQGFLPGEVPEGHFGLESIRQRARLFGGTATIDSRLGIGTCVMVELPLPTQGIE